MIVGSYSRETIRVRRHLWSTPRNAVRTHDYSYVRGDY